MQNSPQWLCLQVGHKSTHREREFAASKGNPVQGTLGQLLTAPLISTLLEGKCLLKVLVNKDTRTKAN